jgi:Tol biopolymer transport system component/predicted Ser/Thr protein kinase
MVGKRLGHYEILEKIGVGGMGEVYRARDTRLDRTVAIKVLPGGLSAQRDRQQRFEREARTISSLNHPHICTLYDIGDQDGVHFLVMEYLEGETLEKRLRKGPLGTEQALRLALEIADALDRAHRQGIIHRDLKPGNIMLTKSGSKLLDFGLAKLKADPIPAAAALTEMTTEPHKLTAEGMILGTLQYMSPEQLEGKEADARTDIFALGIVIYEMLTGRAVFTGKSKASLIAAILSVEPKPLTELVPMTPPALDRAVKTCLAKDPEERFQTAHDLKLQLRWIDEAGSQAGVPAPVAARRKKRERMAWIVAGVAVIVALCFAVFYFRAIRTQVRPIRAFITPPEKTSFNFTGDFGAPEVVSPDGSKLVFGAGDMLWVRGLDDLTARRLEGTKDARFPFWSPDSRSIGFFAGGKLKTIDASGGAAVTVCDAFEPRGGAWNRDGVIVFTPDARAGLYQVSAAGGVPTPVTKLDTSLHSTHRWPFFLPDGKHFLYLATNHANPKGDQTAVYLGSLDGKDNRLLLRTFRNAAYASGYLFFARENTLMAQVFDPGSFELSGEPVRIADNVLDDGGVWRAVFSASENGILAYQSGGGVPGSQLAWFDRSGKQLATLGERAAIFGSRLSPDGRRAAAAIGDPKPDIWVIELNRGVRTRLTFDQHLNHSPIWSPDGKWIAYTSERQNAPANIYKKPSDGAGSDQLVQESKIVQRATAWPADGRFLLYEQGDPAKAQIWAMPLTGDRKSFPFVQTPPWAYDGHFSPDGRWVSYTSRETGRDEIYVAPFPGPGGKWQVSTNGGHWARWRRDGKELFFLAPDNTLMAAEVNAKGSNFGLGAVRSLFRVNWANPGGYNQCTYDVSADGQRILAAVAGEGEAASPITLVVNWTALLQAK